jgi:hypothetical protein
MVTGAAIQLVMRSGPGNTDAIEETVSGIMPMPVRTTESMARPTWFGVESFDHSPGGIVTGDAIHLEMAPGTLPAGDSGFGGAFMPTSANRPAFIGSLSLEAPVVDPIPRGDDVFAI